MKKTNTWTLLALLPFAFAMAACQSSVEALCEASNDCAGGDDAKLEQCIADGETGRQKAEDAGCDGEYDEAADCLADELVCTDGEVDIEASSTSCKDSGSALETCMGEPTPE